MSDCPLHPRGSFGWYVALRADRVMSKPELVTALGECAALRVEVQADRVIEGRCRLVAWHARRGAERLRRVAIVPEGAWLRPEDLR